MNAELPEPISNAEVDELIVRARQDREAFSRLYECYYPQIARYCLRRLPNRAVTEDVLSEIFLEVATHLPTFPGQTNSDFCRWVFRIATSAINAYWRKSHRRQELWTQAAQNGDLRSSSEPDGSSLNHDTDRWSAVQQAILQLEERERTIVSLRFFSDCTYEEIAEVVDSTAGAVRTALSRILGRLREVLKTAEPDFFRSRLPNRG